MYLSFGSVAYRAGYYANSELNNACRLATSPGQRRLSIGGKASAIARQPGQIRVCTGATGMTTKAQLTKQATRSRRREPPSTGSTPASMLQANATDPGAYAPVHSMRRRSSSSLVPARFTAGDASRLRARAAAPTAQFAAARALRRVTLIRSGQCVMVRVLGPGGRSRLR